MTNKIAPTIEQMEQVNEKIEAAQACEIADKHLTDEERAAMVAEFEAVFGTGSYGYPVDGSITDKFIYIIFDWA